MNARITVTGIRRLQNGVSVARANKAIENVDEEIGKIAKEIAVKMANDAPVLTGALRNSLANSYVHTGKLVHELKLDTDGVPYVWRQNFEHRTKRYYITRNVNAVRSTFESRLAKAVARAWN